MDTDSPWCTLHISVPVEIPWLLCNIHTQSHYPNIELLNSCARIMIRYQISKSLDWGTDNEPMISWAKSRHHTHLTILADTCVNSKIWHLRAWLRDQPVFVPSLAVRNDNMSLSITECNFLKTNNNIKLLLRDYEIRFIGCKQISKQKNGGDWHGGCFLPK